jgi:hypothetical protein
MGRSGMTHAETPRVEPFGPNDAQLATPLDHKALPTEFAIAGIPHLLNNRPAISIIRTSALFASHQRHRQGAIGSVVIPPSFVGSVG